MEKVVIQSQDGARAEVFHHGAHVSSWVPAQGQEQLFMSQASELKAGVAIRGGVPIIFPQFAGFGSLPKHGFARTAMWQLKATGKNELGEGYAQFTLKENIEKLLIWPQVFLAEYQVSIIRNQLQLDFQVLNNGDTTFAFTTALHTYFKVDDIKKTQIKGLGGLSYKDTVTNQSACLQSENSLLINAEIDRIYANIKQPILIEQAHQSVKVTQTGFQDAVIWNPGAEKTLQLKDMTPNGYQNMVCVEAATIMRPIKLEPGQIWSGQQKIVCNAAN